MRSGAFVRKLFWGGGGCKESRAPAFAARLRPRQELVCLFSDPWFPPFLLRLIHHFRRLPAVTGVAQALEVPRVGEQCPVPLVVPNVIHVGGLGPDAMPVTLPAEWLPQELPLPEIIRPDFQRVPAPPGGGLPGPWRGLRLVSGAVPLPCQRPTARMSAGPQRFYCHRAITSGAK